MSRRSFLKKIFGSFLTFIGLSGGTYYYARYIEPDLLTVQDTVISKANIPDSFEGFKIIQFSDTHLGFHYNLDQLKKLAEKINQLEPDLILFTGDLVDEPQSYNWQNARLVSILSLLHAPHGKYWIYGNHDHGGYGTQKVKAVMQESGFKLLQNEQTSIARNGEEITLAGLDDVMLGQPDIEQALRESNEERFHLLMVHEPDYADKVQRYPVDVQLSGHSHGGQIQIPLLGYLITPPYAEKYVEGHYTVGDYPLNLYVTRGIGTTRLPYRLLCRPEINIYQLSKGGA
nr:metallophosphoesterase [Thalassobacillus sp. CUG 92003]